MIPFRGCVIGVRLPRNDLECFSMANRCLDRSSQFAISITNQSNVSV